MHRFYCPPDNISKDTAVITDHEQINHIKNVLRFKTNDKIEIFDGKGLLYQGSIRLLSKERIDITLSSKNFIPQDSPTISVAIGIPKEAKLDFIIEKLTELGVDKIIPLQTERTVVKIGPLRSITRLKRWRKIAINAAEQSRRSYVSDIEEIRSLDKLLKDLDAYDLKLILTLSGQRKMLKDVLKNTCLKNILIFIGPEGDFSPKEVLRAGAAGCIPVDLGKPVLKVDTAAIFIISVLNYIFK